METTKIALKHNSHLSDVVEADDFVTNTGSAAGLDLVQVTEQVESRSAVAVVEFSVREHSEQRALSGVDVAQHGKLEVDKLQERSSLCNIHFQFL